MTINTTLAGLSTNPALNGPDGASDLPSQYDDAIRNALSFIAQIRDNVGGYTGGRILNIQYLSATQVPTYNAGTSKLLVYAVGAGGAGGGCPAAGGAFASAGGGGGSGTWAMKLITSGFAGLTATIGAPGAPAAGLPGGAGGSTSLGGILIAPGGNGGGSGTPGASGISGGPGTISGNATGADYFIRGQAGGPGVVLSSLSAFSGAGGSNPLGSGGGQVFTNAINAIAGLAGQGAGSGGSGAVAAQNGATAAGGAGGNGYMLIWELA